MEIGSSAATTTNLAADHKDAGKSSNLGFNSALHPYSIGSSTQQVYPFQGIMQGYLGLGFRVFVLGPSTV